jgi:hypothetical protein
MLLPEYLPQRREGAKFGSQIFLTFASLRLCAFAPLRENIRDLVTHLWLD